MTAKALRRSLVPSGSNLVDDSRLITEARVAAPGGLVATYGARVQSVLEHQMLRGRITARQKAAGDQLYQAWAFGVEGARDETRGCSAWSPAGYRDGQLDAVALYRGAQKAIGLSRWPLLFHVCCLDWSVHRFSNEAGRNRDGLQEVLRTALDDLANYLSVKSDRRT
jgi:hypothetical protein